MRPGNFRDIFKLFLAVAVLLIVVFFFISFVVWALPLNGLADNYRMEKLSHIYNAVDIYAIITPFLSLREAKKNSIRTSIILFLVTIASQSIY